MTVLNWAKHTVVLRLYVCTCLVFVLLFFADRAEVHVAAEAEINTALR